jgi:hypothetical protein
MFDVSMTAVTELKVRDSTARQCCLADGDYCGASLWKQPIS